MIGIEVARNWIYPQHKEELFERMARYFKLVENFLAKE